MIGKDKGRGKVAPREVQVDLTWLNCDQKRSKLLVQPNQEQKWHETIPAFIVDSEQQSPKLLLSSTYSQQLKKIREAVAKEFDKDNDIFLKAKKSKNDSDEKWIREVIQSGTLSDKIAALALIVQESPIHNLKSLDALLGYCQNNKAEQRSSQLAVDALKDLFIHTLLPDRRLQPFDSRPWSRFKNSKVANDQGMSMPTAILLWFEDQLISRVTRFVRFLDEGSSKSNMEYFKKYCMDVSCEMLINKPEQEARLLSILVNKLGDPSKPIVSKAMELLEKILQTHHVMKGVVTREVRQFMSRANLPPRALYVAVTFLTHMRLHKNDQDVAVQLVECYVQLFEVTVNQGQSGSKLLTALLHGINVAFPFFQDKAALTKHMDSLFKMAHTDHFPTATQALTLISHFALDGDNARSGAQQKEAKADVPTITSSTHTAIVDRFYRALYSTLFSEQVTARAKNSMYFKLLYRSMKLDPSNQR